MSWQLYYQLADRARTLDRVAVYNISGVTLTGTAGNPERIQISRATPSLASVLRVQPAMGRWFTEQEGVPGSAAACRALAWAVGPPLRTGSRHRRPIAHAGRTAHDQSSA